MSSRTYHGCIDLVSAETISKVGEDRIHVSVDQPGRHCFDLSTHDYQAFLIILRHHLIDRHRFVMRSEDFLDFVARNCSCVNQSWLPHMDSGIVGVQVVVIHIHQQIVVISYVEQMET